MEIEGIFYDLKTIEGRQKTIQFAKSIKYSYAPAFTTLLIGYSKILDSEIEEAFAYTYFDVSECFYKIFINWKKVDSENLDIESVTFILYHELLHNLFLHFSRPKIKYYYNLNKALTNIILDTWINEYLFFLFKSKKEEYKWVNQNGWTNNKLKSLARKYGINFDFNPEKELVNVEELFNVLDALFFNEDFIIRGLVILIDNGIDSQDDMNQNNNCKNKLDSHEESIRLAKKSAEAIGKGEEELNELLKNYNTILLEHVKKQSSKEMNKEELVFELLNKKDSSLNFLKIKNIVKNASATSYVKTYGHPNRRKSWPGGMPMRGKLKNRIKKIVTAIDVSGSMSKKEIDKLLQALIGFLNRMKKDISLDVIIFSSRKIDIKEDFYENIFTPKELIERIKVISTGGTEIRYVFNFIEEKYSEKITLLIQTDGEITVECVPENVSQLFFLLTTKERYAFIEENYPSSVVNVILS